MKFIKPFILGCLLVVFSTPVFAQQSINIEYSQVKSVVLRGGFCDVKAEGTSSEQVTVSGQIEGKSAERYRITHTFENGNLEILVKSATEGKQKWGWNGNVRGNFSIKVPKNITLKIKNSSGNVDAQKITTDQKITLIASSGNIDASELSGSLTAVASSGDISLADIIGNVGITTSSGNQKLSDVKGNIKSIASSGDVQFRNIIGDLDAVSSSGEMELSHTTGACKLRSSSGDIEGDHITLNASSTFKATSGSIQMDFTNSLSELSFELTASSGSLKVGGNKSEKRLTLKQGNIQVRGITSSGDQHYD